MFNYQIDQDGYIIGTIDGEAQTGWFQTETAVDASMFKIVNGELQEIPMRTFAQIANGKVSSLNNTRRLPMNVTNSVFVDVTAISPMPQVGWRYDNGIFTASVFSLEEAKAVKLAEIKRAFLKECYGVFWFQHSDVKLGYDADKDSNVDFLSALNVSRTMKEKWLLLPVETRGEEPTVPYNVYFENGNKTLYPHKYEQIEAVLLAAAIKQGSCYQKYAGYKASIMSAQNEYDVNAIYYIINA